MRRIFVAVNISEEARRLAASYAEGLRSVVPRSGASWVRPDKHHLTLRFIGNCTDRELEVLTIGVDRIAEKMRPFYLAIKGTGVFPPTRDARVVWLGVCDPSNSLNSIERAIRSTGQAEVAAGGRRQQFSP